MSGTTHKSISEDPVEKGMDGEYQNGKTTASDLDNRRSQTRNETL